MLSEFSRKIITRGFCSPSVTSVTQTDFKRHRYLQVLLPPQVNVTVGGQTQFGGELIERRLPVPVVLPVRQARSGSTAGSLAQVSHLKQQLKARNASAIVTRHEERTCALSSKKQLTVTCEQAEKSGSDFRSIILQINELQANRADNRLQRPRRGQDLASLN